MKTEVLRNCRLLKFRGILKRAHDDKASYEDLWDVVHWVLGVLTGEVAKLCVPGVQNSDSSYPRKGHLVPT